DENHALVSNPDAGTVMTTVFKKETQEVQFPQAGTFTVQSEDAKHRATLTVVVAEASGACAAPKDTLTLTELVGHPDKDSVKPAPLTVEMGAMVTIVNKTDEQHSLSCTPNPGLNGDDPKLDKGESQVVVFTKAGTFTCTSLQHKDAKVKVTVQ